MRARRGFSLLEVCVAGLLLLLVASFVLRPLTSTRRGSQQLDARLQVLRVATELCDELNARPFDDIVAEDGHRSLEWSGCQLELDYQIQVRQMASNLKSVAIRLEWEQGGLDHHLDFGTTIGEVILP
ncbi:MAG: hypothetical protein AB7S38_42845 [Vulcanimicrobiota bacterium]